MLFMVFVASVLFAQTYSFKSADKNPCKVTLNGETIIIEETLFGGYINRITIPKSKFTSTKAQVTSDEGGKSVINNQPHMESIISRKSGQKIPKIANLQYYKSKANYGTKKKGISR